MDKRIADRPLFRLPFSYLLVGCGLLAGCEAHGTDFHIGGHTYNIDRFRQWKLPKALTEVSGLALTEDGRLLAHDDERARVYVIDPESGKRLGAFDLTDAPNAANPRAIRADFEGIAVADGHVYLVTSDGIIFRAPLAAVGATVATERFPTPAGDACEIEGLAHHPGLGSLLLACKKPRIRRHGVITVFQWSLARQTLLPGDSIRVDLASAHQFDRSTRINPSGIAVAPQTGTMVIVAARQRLLIEAGMDGKVLRVIGLPKRYHPQTEGIAFGVDDSLILADEGGSKRGQLGVYTRSH